MLVRNSDDAELIFQDVEGVPVLELVCFGQVNHAPTTALKLGLYLMFMLQRVDLALRRSAVHVANPEERHLRVPGHLRFINVFESDVSLNPLRYAACNGSQVLLDTRRFDVAQRFPYNPHDGAVVFP